MWRSFKEHLPTTWGYWWAVVPMLVASIAGIILDIAQSAQRHDPLLPLWAWILIGVSGIPIAQFLAFHKVRVQRDERQAQLDRIRDSLLGNLSVDNLHFGFGDITESSFSVQPAIRLLNSADIPVKYNVTAITAVVSGRTAENPLLRMRTGVIPSGLSRLFLYAAIPDVPLKFPTQCVLKYTIQYGPISEDYTHVFSEGLTVTLHSDEPSRAVSWVYLVDTNDYRHL